jgi:hypothetical protein
MLLQMLAAFETAGARAEALQECLPMMSRERT